jgi:hypothetical protein
MLRIYKLQIRSPARLITSVALSLVTFVILMPFARLDFDSHHDGFMLAQAIAIRDGLSIHSEISSPYGPVTPWLQSWALSLPLGPALALRVLNSALIALTVFLIADIGRNRHRSSPLTYGAGVFAAVTWVLLADVWLGVTMLPWSSTLVAMLTALFLYLFSRARTSELRGRSRSSTILSVLAGCSLGIMMFTRLSVGVGTLLVVVVGVFIIDRGTERPGRNQLPYVLLGAAIGVMGIIARLVVEGSWGAYVDDSILWPLKFGSEYGALSLSRQVEFLIYILPQVVSVGAVLLVVGLQFVHRGRWRAKAPLWMGILTILSGILVVAVQDRGIVLDATGPQWWRYLVSPNFIFQYGTFPQDGFIYFFFLLTLIAALTVLVVASIERIRRRLSTLRLGYWVLIAGLALAGASGVWPMWDSRHVWWGASIGLLCVTSLIGAVGSLWKPFRNPLLIPVLAVAIMVVFSGTNVLRQPRTSSPASWVTSGMELPEVTVITLGEEMDLLRRYAGGGQKAIFLTQNGNLSILLGSFQSADRYFTGSTNPYYVGIGPKTELSERLEGSPVVFIRGIDESVIAPEALRALNGYRLAESNGSLMVFVPKEPQ